MNHSGDIKALFIIVNAGFSAMAMEIARAEGTKGATIINARGEGARQQSIMGITVDAEREMILCLIDSATADKVMAAIKEKAGRDSPANGICFTMPIERTTIINDFIPDSAKRG